MTARHACIPIGGPPCAVAAVSAAVEVATSAAAPEPEPEPTKAAGTYTGSAVDVMMGVCRAV